MKETIMIDITALAEAHWKKLNMPKEFSMTQQRLREIVIIAFESGYMAHSHEGVKND